jgi:hypothetical protein
MSCATESFSPAQARTVKARETFNARFKTPDEKREYFRKLGERGNAGQVTLRAAEVAALVDAVTILSRLAERAAAEVTR